MSFKDDVLATLQQGQEMSYIDKIASLREQKNFLNELLEQDLQKIAAYQEIAEIVKTAAEDLEDQELFETADILETIAMAEAEDINSEEKIASEKDFMQKVAQEVEKISLLADIGKYFYNYGKESGLDKLAEFGKMIYATAEEEAEMLENMTKEAGVNLKELLQKAVAGTKSVGKKAWGKTKGGADYIWKGLKLEDLKNNKLRAAIAYSLLGGTAGGAGYLGYKKMKKK